jgi:hypothetical protein
MTNDHANARARETEPDLPERGWYLALLAAGPFIWMLQFLLAYATASLLCSPVVAENGGSFVLVRWAIAAYTIAALAAIAIVARDGYRRHAYGGSETEPYDMDTPADRHRFLGFATLLLAGLSAVAALFTGLTGIFFTSCR